MRQSRRLGIFVSGGIVPLTSSDYTYTGIANFIDEGDGNWQIKFLTSGTFTLKSRSKQLIDVFCVGGGGAGGRSSLVNYGSGGAGGGWTKTYTQMELKKGFSCSIVVGAGATAADGNGANGGQTYFNTTDYSANGGFGGKASTRSPFTTGDGGWGGSGGGSGAAGDKNGGAGGTDGSAGSYSGSGSGTNLGDPGPGQGRTTRAFAETSGTLYSNGGKGGGRDVRNGASGGANTGNGGGGQGTYNSTSHTSGSGGSGIVIIRNAR